MCGYLNRQTVEISFKKTWTLAKKRETLEKK